MTRITLNPEITEYLEQYRDILREAFAPVAGDNPSPYTREAARSLPSGATLDPLVAARDLGVLTASAPRPSSHLPASVRLAAGALSETLREGRAEALAVDLSLSGRGELETRLPPETRRTRTWEREHRLSERRERREAVERRRHARRDAAFVDRLIAGGSDAVRGRRRRGSESDAAVEALLGGSRITVDEAELNELMTASFSRGHRARPRREADSAARPGLQYAMSFTGWEGYQDHLVSRES